MVCRVIPMTISVTMKKVFKKLIVGMCMVGMLFANSGCATSYGPRYRTFDTYDEFRNVSHKNLSIFTKGLMGLHIKTQCSGQSNEVTNVFFNVLTESRFEQVDKLFLIVDEKRYSFPKAIAPSGLPYKDLFSVRPQFLLIMAKAKTIRFKVGSTITNLLPEDIKRIQDFVKTLSIKEQSAEQPELGFSIKVPSQEEVIKTIQQTTDAIVEQMKRIQKDAGKAAVDMSEATGGASAKAGKDAYIKALQEMSDASKGAMGTSINK